MKQSLCDNEGLERGQNSTGLGCRNFEQAAEPTEFLAWLLSRRCGIRVYNQAKQVQPGFCGGALEAEHAQQLFVEHDDACRQTSAVNACLRRFDTSMSCACV